MKMKYGENRKTAQKRYQEEGLRGQTPLPEGWDHREYLHADGIAEGVLGVYHSLNEKGILTLLHERQSQKPHDEKMVFRTNIGNAVRKAKESKQLKKEEDEITDDVEEVGDE